MWLNRTYSTSGGHTLLEDSTNFNSSTTGFGFFPDDGSDCPTTSPMLIGVHGNVGYSLNCYAQPSSGVWHHLAIIYDKTQAGANVVSLYIDGVLQTPGMQLFTYTNTNSFGNNPIYLFSREGTQDYCAGEVDELQLYNRALAAGEIQQIYNPAFPVPFTLALNPTSLPGGAISVGTVNLSTPAPSGGAVVTISSSNTTVVTVPTSVTVPAGSTVANFTIGTSAVTSLTPVTIFGTYGVTESANIAITPAGVVGVGQLVQSASGDGGSALSETVHQGSNATTGNLILVFSHWDNQTITASVTDNMGNTYSAIEGPVSSGPSACFQAWYAKNITGGTPLAVTVAYSGQTATSSVVDVIEYSGLDTAGPVDVYALATGSGLTQDSGLAATTSATSETLIGLFGYDTHTAPYVAGTGYIMRGYDASSMWEDRYVTAVGAYNATSTSSAQANWAAYVIGFKNASSPFSLSLNPASVTGGGTATGTLTLNSAAPVGGATITLASSNTAAATVPTNVTVAAGSTTANFTVNTYGVIFNTLVSVTATYANGSQGASLTVTPGVISQVVSDTFNRANASNLGPNWSPLVGTTDVPFQIVGAQVESMAVNPSIAKEMYYGGLSWTPDQYSEVQILAANGGGGYEGPAVRMTSNDSYYACLVSNLGTGNASTSIVLSNAGTGTTLTNSITSTVRTGDTVRCTVRGNVVTMTNQTTSATLLTVTDSSIPSGYPGLVGSAGTISVTSYVMTKWASGAGGSSLVALQLGSDDFNRANGLNLGTNWNVGPGHGPIQLINQQVQPYPAGGVQPSKEHYVAYGAFPNDQYSQVQVVTQDTLGDLACEIRASDTSDTMYVADVNLTGGPGTAETRIVRVLNGIITDLAVDSVWSSVSPGDYIRGQVQGNLISLIDMTMGTLLLSAFDTNIASGYPGISLQALNGTPSDHIAAHWSGGTLH
jgi:hypothetical protein